MEKFAEKIANFVEPVAEWVQKMKFLIALSETMQALLPITVIGSFACLFAFLGVDSWQAFIWAHPILAMGFMNAQSWTLSIIALYTVAVLPYMYAKKLEMDEPLSCVPLAIAAFLLLTPTELYTAIPTTWLGHTGMFTAFIVAFVVVRFVKLCQDKNITIKMPEGVPHYIEATFAVLIPAFVIVFCSTFIGQALSNTSAGSIHQIIYTFIQAPLLNLGSSFGGTLVQEFAMTLAMFCGIHGSSVVPWQDAMVTALNEENAAAIAAGKSIPNIIGSGSMNIIQMGGIGATLGLAILMVIFCKSKRYQQLSRVALVPQIFNIGEPLLFGIPIMLNPVLFLPYMGGVLANTLIVYFSIASGLVGRPNGVNPSWTLPGPLQGLVAISTPVRGMILALVVLAVDMLIWYPFIRMIDRQALEEEAAGNEQKAGLWWPVSFFLYPFSIVSSCLAVEIGIHDIACDLSRYSCRYSAFVVHRKECSIEGDNIFCLLKRGI